MQGLRTCVQGSYSGLDRATSWPGSAGVGLGRGRGLLCHRTRAKRAAGQPG